MLEDTLLAISAPARSRANETLERTAVSGLRRLQVDETDSDVTISGTVTCYFLKQLAQEAIMPDLGHRKLHNCVEVHRNDAKARPWEAGLETE